METRNQFIGVNSIKFYKRFQSDEDCCKYLADIKLQEGYVCKKCGNTHYCQGRKPYSRWCCKCKYDESLATGIMFDELKFSLLVAFHIAFEISAKRKGMFSFELSEKYELMQMAYWTFRRRIQQIMKSSCLYPLEGEVYIDEFYVGGEEEQKRGRLKGRKNLCRSL